MTHGQETPQGYKRWMYHEPPATLCLFWRPSWPEPVVDYPWNQIGNEAVLLWALTAVAKAEMEGM